MNGVRPFILVLQHNAELDSQNRKNCINVYIVHINVEMGYQMFNTVVKFAILSLLQETPKGFSVIRDQNYSCNQKGFQSNNHLILVMLALGFFTKREHLK